MIRFEQHSHWRNKGWYAAVRKKFKKMSTQKHGSVIVSLLKRFHFRYLDGRGGGSLRNRVENHLVHKTFRNPKLNFFSQNRRKNNSN